MTAPIGPLSGIRVLELTTLVTGSLCGQMLGDLGADIVKIERPEGDPFRQWHSGTYSPMFMALNRNKRSITLNLTTKAGREVALKLADEADVFIENARPGVADKLGMSAEALAARNPNLIYCAISGFGLDGPYVQKPAFDSVAQSLTGLTSLFVDPKDPKIVGPTIADDMTGIMACYGVLGALFDRERGGPARRVDVNMIDSTAAFVGAMYVMYDQLKQPIGPMTRVKGSQSYAMACADGKQLALHLSSPDKFWKGTIEAFGLEQYRDNPETEKRMGRVKHYDEIALALKAKAVTQPRDHWMERLEANDVPYAPIHSISEVFDDPQVKHLGVFAEVEKQGVGPQRLPRRSVWYDKSRADAPLVPAPLLGEHSDEILGQLGYDAASVTKLRQSGVL